MSSAASPVPLTRGDAWPRRGICADCRHFTGEPLALEAAFAGLSSLSSAFASVRSEDGLCRLHDRYVAGSSACASFASDGSCATAPSPLDATSTSTRQS